MLNMKDRDRDGNNRESNSVAKILAVMCAAIGITLLCMALESRDKASRVQVKVNETEASSAVPPKLSQPEVETGQPAQTDSLLIMKTTKGTVKLELFCKDAPITSKNFLFLVDRGFYDGLTFHRYEPGFIIQGGDPTGTGTGGYVDPQTGVTKTIPLEVSPGLSHNVAGTLGLARAADPNSGSSQFYLTLAQQTSFLDGKYTVFGKVVDGLGTVRSLRRGDRIVSLRRVSAEPTQSD